MKGNNVPSLSEYSQELIAQDVCEKLSNRTKGLIKAIAHNFFFDEKLYSKNLNSEQTQEREAQNFIKEEFCVHLQAYSITDELISANIQVKILMLVRDEGGYFIDTLGKIH